MKLKTLILATAASGIIATPALAEVTYLPQAKVDAALAGKGKPIQVDYYQVSEKNLAISKLFSEQCA